MRDRQCLCELQEPRQRSDAQASAHLCKLEWTCATATRLTDSRARARCLLSRSLGQESVPRREGLHFYVTPSEEVGGEKPTQGVPWRLASWRDGATSQLRRAAKRARRHLRYLSGGESGCCGRCWYSGSVAGQGGGVPFCDRGKRGPRLGARIFSSQFFHSLAVL